jgi:hypothetical protein
MIEMTTRPGYPSIGQKCLVWDVDYQEWIIAAWMGNDQNINEGHFKEIDKSKDINSPEYFRVVRWKAWQALPDPFLRWQ